MDNWNACNGNGQGYAGKDDQKNNNCDATGEAFEAISTAFQGNIIVKE
jgi:hypothetical protein